MNPAIPSTPFVYPESISPDEEQAIRLETIVRLVQYLASGTVAQDSQRLEMIAFLLCVSKCQTQAELAERLGLSPGRVSQGLNIARAEIARLSAAK